MLQPVSRRPARLAALLVLALGCGPSVTGDGTTERQAGTVGVSFNVTVGRPTDGRVTSADGKIRCGPAATDNVCTASFAWTARVTLSATPNAGFAFQNWAGDCYLSPCILDTTRTGSDKYVVAVFVKAAQLGHPNWTSHADHGPAYFRYLGGQPNTPQCPSCHGENLQGVGIAANCWDCHRRAGWVGDWRTNCSFCHGATTAAAKAGYVFAEHPEWSAPPGAISERLTGVPAPAKTGAHQTHLRGVTAEGLRFAAPFRCETCHPVRASHVRGEPAEVALVGAGQASLPASLGTYAPATGTCATYCHGPAAPTWAGGPVRCGSCHALPPATAGHPPAAPDPRGCAMCHPKTVLSDGTIDVAGALHVNGVLDATPCGGCHALPPQTGAHAAHYGLAAEDAPVGYADTGVLQDRFPGATPATAPDAYAFGCGNCHATEFGRHMDGTANVVLAGGAPAGSLKARNAADAAYDPAAGTCSGVYCHSSGQASPAYVTTPAWTSEAPLGCAGCHANPPRYPSGGAGSATANSHVNFADDNWEFGHFGGLIGPWLDNRHGRAGAGAAPITCQTCHADTVDPANTGPSGFYYLDTTGDYQLPGGDATRYGYAWYALLQCTTCHSASSPTAPLGTGKVRALRHVNGVREVVFDARTTLPEIAWLPAAPNRPVAPYWMTPAGDMWRRYGVAATYSGETISFSLAPASYDPATKTCTSVACHVVESPRWGTPYRWVASGSPTCYACHPNF